MAIGTTSFPGQGSRRTLSLSLLRNIIAYLLRPRWAVVQVFLSAGFVYVLLYFACPHTGWAGWKSECYSPGPDGLAGIRLCAMMFSFGALPALIRASYKEDKLNKRLRRGLRFSARSSPQWSPRGSYCMVPGATYLTPLVPFQAALLFGVSEIARDTCSQNKQINCRRSGFRSNIHSHHLRVSMADSMRGCDRSLLSSSYLPGESSP